MLPFSSRIYYGWVIAATMGAVGACSMGLATLNFGLFIKPMGDELGIGRTAFGLAQSSRQVAAALAAPVVGPWIDRWGARYLLALAAVLTGAGVALLYFVDAGWQIVLLFAVMGVLGIGGPGSLVTAVPVTKWFVRQRGRALAWMSLGVPLGGITIMPLSQWLIEAFGWRAAWPFLAGLAVAIIVPLSLIFVRRIPEDHGLQPDGGWVPLEAGGIARDEEAWTRAEAFASSAFWRLVIAFSLIGLGVGSIALHRIAAFMDRGLDPMMISFATGLDAAASGVTQFAAGLLIHRIPIRFVGAFGFLLLATASILTILTFGNALLFASMIFFGFGIGVWILLETFIWADYFGRQNLGSIRGAVMPVTLISGAAGAPIAGYVRDITGAYEVAWYVGVSLMIVAALILVATPKPTRPTIDT